MDGCTHSIRGAFITFFDASTFVFQKDSSKFFKNYLMLNLTQGYSSLETREPDLELRPKLGQTLEPSNNG
jgi:hypothetical protein